MSFRVAKLPFLDDETQLVGSDHLEFGPSCWDPAEHDAARQAFLQECLAREAAGQSIRKRRAPARRKNAKSGVEWFSATSVRKVFDVKPAQPVTWLTLPIWDQRLLLWWFLSMATEAGIEPQRIRVVSPSEDILESLPPNCHSDSAIGAALDFMRSSRPVAQEEVSAARALWRAYTLPTPAQFETIRRSGCPPFPELSRIAQFYRRLFPRLGSAGRYRLSNWDEGLLSLLSGREWRRPVDFFVRSEEMLYSSGWALQRLLTWSAPATAQLIESRPKPDGVNSLTRVEFRLTDYGEAACREGMEAIEHGVPFRVGGWTVYDPQEPFVVVETNEWSVVPLAEAR